MKASIPKPSFFTKSQVLFKTICFLLFFFSAAPVFAQAPDEAADSLFSLPGIIITIILLIIPLAGAFLLFAVKARNIFNRIQARKDTDEAVRFAEYLKKLDAEQLAVLRENKQIRNYLPGGKLSGTLPPEDTLGLLSNINEHANLRFIAEKRKALKRPNVEPGLARLILWFLATATFWLVFGTSVGEYV